MNLKNEVKAKTNYLDLAVRLGWGYSRLAMKLNGNLRITPQEEIHIREKLAEIEWENAKIENFRQSLVK